MQTSLSTSQIYPLDNSKLKLSERVALNFRFTLGFCPICGCPTVFAKFNQNFRESGNCIHCRASNRKRQIAWALLSAIKEKTNIKFSSIKHFTQKLDVFDKASNLKIYNTETDGSLHHYLSQSSNYIASEFVGDEYTSGEVIDGLTHQNLMATSFSDDSIDIVLSSDVFEHIPDPYRAFTEVYRILKPGGRHIFTVPFYHNSYRDEVRALMREDGVVEHILPPIYHHDPLRPEGTLVYVIFSLEMLLKLNDIGYQVKLYNLRNPLKGILGANALVFDAIKPA